MPSGPPVQRASLVSTIAIENAEAERRDGEVMAAAVCRIGRPTSEGEQPGKQQRLRTARPGRDAEMRRTDRHRVGADAEEAGVAEADLSGKAHQQIEADHRQGEMKTRAAMRR